MSVESEYVKACDGCGASIYPEHIENRVAERIGGKLLCPHCVQRRRHAPAEVSAVRTAPFRRTLNPDVDTATRCKTFHCKVGDAAFGHLNDQINDWIDAHDDVRVKFATSTVATIEGKHIEPHLIVTVFY